MRLFFTTTRPLSFLHHSMCSEYWCVTSVCTVFSALEKKTRNNHTEAMSGLFSAAFYFKHRSQRILLFLVLTLSITDISILVQDTGYRCRWACFWSAALSSWSNQIVVNPNKMWLLVWSDTEMMNLCICMVIMCYWGKEVEDEPLLEAQNTLIFEGL